jgi:hypothetical protein
MTTVFCNVAPCSLADTGFRFASPDQNVLLFQRLNVKVERLARLLRTQEASGQNFVQKLSILTDIIRDFLSFSRQITG